MPNWCYNSVRFRGTPSSLRDMVSAIHGNHGPLSFDKVIPEPKSPTASDEPHPDWYEWRCLNWGTKWDIDSPGNTTLSVQLAPAEMSMNFDTAWSPPLPVTAAISKRFPSLTVDHIYSDESMGAAGRTVWSSGRLLHHREHGHGTSEYEHIVRGRRPEESSLVDFDWSRDLLTARAIAKIDRPPLPSPSPSEIWSGPAALLKKMTLVEKLSAMVHQSAFAMAKSQGFPLESWIDAGLDLESESIWTPRVRPLKVSPNRSNPRLSVIASLASPSMAPISLSLSRRGHLRPQSSIDAAGTVSRTPEGLIIALPSGWSVNAGIRDGEGFAMFCQGGLCQTPPDGQPACFHWKINPQTHRPFLFSTAHAVAGKLWDKSRHDLAFVEYRADGSVLRSASFFAGRFSTGSSKTSVTRLEEHSPLPPSRCLANTNPVLKTPHLRPVALASPNISVPSAP